MISAINSFNPNVRQQKSNVSFGMSREWKLTAGAIGSVAAIWGSAVNTIARRSNAYHLNISPEILNVVDNILLFGGAITLVTIAAIAIFGKKSTRQS